MVVLIERVSDAQLSVSIHNGVFYFIVDIFVDDQTTCRCTTLTGRSYGTKHSTRHYDLQIGAWCNDYGVVSAQFEERFAQTTCDGLCHSFPHAGRTGCRYQWNTYVVRHQLAELGITDQEAGNTFRNFVRSKYFLGDLLAGNSRKRCFFRWLPNTNVTANPCKGRVPVPNRNREVERGDNSHDSQRVVLLVHAVRRALGMHGQTVKLTGKSHSEITDVNHFLNFTQTFLERFTHFIRNQLTQRLFVFADLFSKLTNHFSTLRCRNCAPNFECFLSFQDHCFVFCFGSSVYGGDQLAVCRGKGIDFRSAGVEPVTSCGCTTVYRFDTQLVEDMLNFKSCLNC